MKFVLKTGIIYLLLFIYGCKKDDGPSNTISSNNIVVHVDKVGALDFNKSSYNFATERFSDCAYGFARTAYDGEVRTAFNYNIFEINIYDCNIQSFPHKVLGYFLYLDLQVPNKGGYRVRTDDQKNMNLTITSIEDKRVKGTFEGVLYNTYDDDSLKVKGQFDIDYSMKF
ncbi:MAG TPA: hypothetical protein VF691_00615 [Cytophagaceae bacterium]|jgi:hypothetical protein